MEKIQSGPVCSLDRRCMRVKHFYPLMAFLIPTIVIGYGFVIPRSPIAGINQFTIGFASALLGATVAYWQGVRFALRKDADNRRGERAGT
jgi:ABC-type Fe3+ transport system permease subunit